MPKMNTLQFAEGLKPWPITLKRPNHPVFPEFREFAPHSVETYAPWPSLFSFHLINSPERFELKDGIIPALFYLHKNPGIDPDRCYFSPQLKVFLPIAWQEAQFVYFSAPLKSAQVAYIEFYDGVSSLRQFEQRIQSLPLSVGSLVLDLRLNSAREGSDAGRLMELIRRLPDRMKLITVDELIGKNMSQKSCLFHFESLLVGSSFLQEQVLLQGGGISEIPHSDGELTQSYWITPQARKDIYRETLKIGDLLLKKELFKVVKKADTLKELLKPQTLRVIAELVGEMEKHHDQN